MPVSDRDTLESLSHRLIASELRIELLEKITEQVGEQLLEVARHNVRINGRLLATRAFLQTILYDVAVLMGAKKWKNISQRKAVWMELAGSFLGPDATMEEVFKFMKIDDQNNTNTDMMEDEARKFYDLIKSEVEAYWKYDQS